MVFLAAVATAIQLLWPGTSAAQTGQPESEQPSPPGAAEPTVELVDQSTWVARDETFSMRIALTRVPPEAQVNLDVYPRLSGRHDFREVLSDGVDEEPIGTAFSAAVGDISLEADGSLSMSFSPLDSGLEDEGGVYPLTLLVTDEAGDPIGGFITFLLLLPPAFPDYTPLTVTPVFEVGASLGLQPDGSTHIPADELDRIRARADALEQLDIPVTVAPAPETVDALDQVPEDEPESDQTSTTNASEPSDLDSDDDDGTGGDADQTTGGDGTGDSETSETSTDADPLSEELADALAGKELLARPYVDIDLEAWAAADLLPEAPRQFETGVETVRSHYGTDPARNIWLAGSTISPTEAAAWRDMGFRHSLLPASALSSAPAADGWGGIAPPVQLPDGPVGFVSDDGLVDRLVNLEDALDAHYFVSELAMLWLEFPAVPRAVVLRIPAQAPFDPDLVAEALNRMGNDQAINPATASELFERYDSGSGLEERLVPAELAPKQSIDDLGEVAPSVEQSEQTLTGLSAIVESATLVSSLEKSLLVASGARTPNSERRGYLDRVSTAADEISGGINAPETFRITLTAREGTIPLTISNDLGHEVSVRVLLESNQLEFLDGEELDVVVPPQGLRTDLRVRPRTSGAFLLHVTITSPDGNLVVDETTFNVRSTVISGVGLVLSVGAGLFLVIWWARHWRRTRRPSVH